MTPNANKKDKGKEPDSEPEDDRKKCPYCNQGVDDKILDAQDVKTEVKIPAGKWKLINKHQAKIDDLQAEMEEVRLSLRRKINEFAKANDLVFMSGLGVNPNPPKKDEENHQWQFFVLDDSESPAQRTTPSLPQRTSRNYLDGQFLNEAQQKELKDLYWDLGALSEQLEEASSKYNLKLTEIARAMDWYFQPIVDHRKMAFVAPSVIENAVEQAKEQTEKKIRNEYEKK
jgi:hypothetical protein